MTPRKLHPLAVAAITIILSACGGGGGDSASTDSSVSAPVARSSTVTGLSSPTLTLTPAISAAIPLVEEMVNAYQQASTASALKELGSLALTPGFGSTSAGTTACAASGSVDFSAENTGTLQYTYASCSTGSYQFDGNSTATVSRDGAGEVTGYSVSFTGLQVAGANVTQSPGGLSGTVTCSLSGGTPSCTVLYASYLWGFDAAFGAGGTANGTHQCDCGQGTWNVTFVNFTATGGTAEVFATNGSAIVARAGGNSFTVTMFVSGVARTYSVTL